LCADPQIKILSVAIHPTRVSNHLAQCESERKDSGVCVTSALLLLLLTEIQSAHF
jgi:hypothetical protein